VYHCFIGTITIISSCRMSFLFIIDVSCKLSWARYMGRSSLLFYYICLRLVERVNPSFCFGIGARVKVPDTECGANHVLQYVTVCGLQWAVVPSATERVDSIPAWTKAKHTSPS